MTSKSYPFPATCPVCNELRKVIANKQQIDQGHEQVEVFSCECVHHWKLTYEQSTKLRTAVREQHPG